MHSVGLGYRTREVRLRESLDPPNNPEPLNPEPRAQWRVSPRKLIIKGAKGEMKLGHSKNLLEVL